MCTARTQYVLNTLQHRYIDTEQYRLNGQRLGSICRQHDVDKYFWNLFYLLVHFTQLGILHKLQISTSRLNPYPRDTLIDSSTSFKCSVLNINERKMHVYHLYVFKKVLYVRRSTYD